MHSSDQTDGAHFADVYARISGWQRARGLELIEDAQFRKGEFVLDVGCGPGDLTAELARRVGADGDALGIDPDKNRIKLANERFQAQLPQLRFAVAQGEDMSVVQSGTVDVIFSNYAIQWVKDKVPFLAEFQRCLKPGGRFALEKLAARIDLYEEIMEISPTCPQKAADTVDILSEAKWLPLLRSAGFVVDQSRTIDSEIHFASVEECYDWWEGVTHGAFQRKYVEPAHREGFEATFVNGRTATATSVRVLGHKPIS